MSILRLKRNTRGRDFLVGDIHGEYRALAAHLEMIGFQPEKGDRLLATGDLVDRGTNSAECLDWMSEDWFYTVKGNHEVMCVASHNQELSEFSHWCDGGDWFLDLDHATRTIYADAFEALPVAIELETSQGLVGIVHADLPVTDWRCLEPALHGPDGLRFARICMWSRRRFRRKQEEQIGGVRAVVCGHHAVERVKWLGNVVCIDTGAVYPDGHFTIFDAETLKPARIRGMSDITPCSP